MADRDFPFERRSYEDRQSRLIGPHADDPAFDPYYRSDPRREPPEPVDSDYPGYSEYARHRDDPVYDEYPFEYEDGDFEEPPPRRKKRWIILKWMLRLAMGFLTLLLLWLIIFAPISQTAEPLVPPPIVLTAEDGSPVARMGPVMDRPVRVDELPDYVAQAFMAIEDRRYEDHWGIDPRGIARALWTNITSDATHGGSTITQQLAKLTYLESDRTLSRKIQEVPIALWLEIWLSKDEILERYLSNVYFGDNVYGLRAASLHYFYRHPENLTLSQATMLAGLVKAPSRLAPTRNLEGAQARQQVVIAAMADAGYLTRAEADAIELATVDHRPPPAMPRGGYFADWAIQEARAGRDRGYQSVEVATTLNQDLQALAERVTQQQTPAGAQVALVAMRPNGEVVAMVGGRDYSESPFNRATQANRQPGSTFKLIVYLAALEAGMTPDMLVDDSPIETGSYRPSNYGGRYRGEITLREAFAYSSNVVAVRLYQELGSEAVANAAEILGIDREFPANASVALGSAEMPLIELVSAYAMVLNDGYQVDPHAIARPEPGVFERFLDRRPRLSAHRRNQLRDLLETAITDGTGRAANLSIPAFGKTGTSQDSRDTLFVGFAGNLVVGIWIGNDDNTPLGEASGGGIPAQMWRAFMIGAVPNAEPRRARSIDSGGDDRVAILSNPEFRIDPDGGITIDTQLGGARITFDGDELNFEPNDDLRRRLDELEELGDRADRAIDENERSGR
ncbi:penicillin-binding protein [Parasphingopyxis sp. CP4]|uniref:transglycosylase domain-containing protein n=1 Tax=Parasphingopyxis sp. CP4 TaxID=2724527 RepID=UPI0015A39C5B|nr:transglycosylase domain-containing protein [Parasphingopyxis sp. CP4]QLC21078.1 penicillin-binding protein [Parasphingopyxis sp. CP4]